jgi:hypothetical protein
MKSIDIDRLEVEAAEEKLFNATEEAIGMMRGVLESVSDRDLKLYDILKELISARSHQRHCCFGEGSERIFFASRLNSR